MSDFNLFLLNKLSQLKSGSSSGGSGAGAQGQTLDTGTNSGSGMFNPVFMVQSVNLRTAMHSSTTGYYSSSLNGYSTFQPYTDNVANNTVAFFGASGMVNPYKGQEAAGENSTGYNASRIPHQQLLFGDHYMMGTDQYQNAVGSHSTSYTPIMYGIMFVKNTTDTAITRTLYSRTSVQANSGYQYAYVSYYTPNAANYGDVTNITRNVVSTSTTNATNWTAGNQITIPAKTTVAVVLYNSVNYNTGIYNGHQVLYRQMFYNLHTFFNADASIQCDAKATLAYLTLKDGDFSAAKATDYSDITRFYNNIAAVYGENE